MPPLLALVICVLSVGYFLSVEKKQHPHVSNAQWLPTIWILYTASRPLGTWFRVSISDPETGSPLDRAFLLTFLFVILVLLRRRKINWVRELRANTWLFVVLGFMFVSIAWSEIPFASIKRFTREIIVVLAGFAILTDKNPAEALVSVLYRAIYIMVPFSLLLIKYFPRYGVSYGRWSGDQTWTGVAQQKNGLGQLCAVAVFLIVWRLATKYRSPDGRRDRIVSLIELIMLAMAVAMLRGPGGAYSATSIVMLAGAISLLVVLLFLRRRHLSLPSFVVPVAMCFIIAFGTATVFMGKLPFLDISSSLGRNSTLTDRNLVWSSLVPQAMRSPLIGHGFGGFWTSQTRHLYEIPNAHSGYLEVILSMGFIGLLLISIFILMSCVKAQKELGRNHIWGNLWLCCLMMTLINNIAESSLDSFTPLLMTIPLWFTIVLGRLSLSIQTRENGGGA